MSSKREILGIQYLRGIAACAVVFDHASAMASFEKYFDQRLWGGWLEKGALGVDLFFMISGFIISIVALRKNTLEPAISRIEFARRRALRVLPMMWLAIISYALLRTAAGIDQNLWPYVRAVALWPIGDLDPNLIWTLRHEAIFYIMFAATFLSGPLLRPLMLFWILSPIAYAFSGFVPDTEGVFPALMRTLSHPVNVEFGFGLLLGIVWTKWLHNVFVTVPHLILVLVAYFILVMLIGNLLDLDVNSVSDTIITSLLFIPLMLVGIWGNSLPNKVGLLLGNASFAIYLFHAHIVSAILRGWSAVSPESPVEAVVGLTALIAIVGGVTVHILFERPLQIRLRDWWHQGRLRKREI